MTAAVCGPAPGADDYEPGPDSRPRPGVPAGREEPLSLPESWNFPGTVRDAWIYVPAQYDPAKPACLMVLQDGGGYVKRDGAWRVPVVFDNLIAAGEMPVTIGVFLNPGVVPAANPGALPRFNRSFEYDSMGDRYARFLLEEVLPEVRRKYNVSTDPNDCAIGGASSGAICAFTVAWERPDAFRRVFSTIGTYTGLRGGNEYPTLIRKCEPRPMRIFLQDGSGDLNIYGGDWWLANQSMLSALTFSGYDVKHVWGDGGHNAKHGSAIFPDAMRWLWRDHGKPITAATEGRNLALEIVVPGEDWVLVSEGHRFTEGPTCAPDGTVFFADPGGQTIHRVGPDGGVSVFAGNTGGADGMEFGPDGRLYAACNRDRCIAAWDIHTGERTVIVQGVEPNDVVVAHTGDLWFTDHRNRRVHHVSPSGVLRTVDEGITFPNGICLSPDQTLLYVADTRGQFVYSFQVTSGGELRFRQEYYHLHRPDAVPGSGADGVVCDTAGRLYVATAMGIQVCDQAGRVNTILRLPPNGRISNLTFGGPQRDTLFATAGDKVWKRRTKVTGVRAADSPVKPPPPRL